jgi:hypothetical protein
MTVRDDQPVPLRRNRDFQLLWSGQAISALGSQTSKIAYPLLVLAMTGSPARAGIAGFAAMLGYLLFPLPAGSIADRYDRKGLMIGCDCARLLAVGSIAIAGWAAHITYPQVLIAGFIEGSASVFFNITQRAALPMIVHASQRPLATSQNEARTYGAQLAGPALGGSLFGLDWSAPFAVDAFTYVASLVTLPFIKTPMQAPAARESRRSRLPGSFGSSRSSGSSGLGMLASLREGVAFTWRQPFLRYGAMFAGAVNLLLQVQVLGIIVLARHDGASAAQTGLIIGCTGAGGLAGAFVAPRLQRTIPAGFTITGCMWVWAIVFGLMVGVGVPLWLCPLMAVSGFIGPAWNVATQTYRMRITPNEMLGRASSVALQIGWGVIPFGSLLAGFLLEALSPGTVIALVAASMTLVALTASVLRPIRRAGRDDRLLSAGAQLAGEGG